MKHHQRSFYSFITFASCFAILLLFTTLSCSNKLHQKEVMRLHEQLTLQAIDTAFINYFYVLNTDDSIYIHRDIEYRSGSFVLESYVPDFATQKKTSLDSNYLNKKYTFQLPEYNKGNIFISDGDFDLATNKSAYIAFSPLIPRNKKALQEVKDRGVKEDFSDRYILQAYGYSIVANIRAGTQLFLDFRIQSGKIISYELYSLSYTGYMEEF